jgi:hypothetical protein
MENAPRILPYIENSPIKTYEKNEGTEKRYGPFKGRPINRRQPLHSHCIQPLSHINIQWLLQENKAVLKSKKRHE